MTTGGSPRKLSLLDATMLVMGAILGVGIFFNPSQVAGYVPQLGAYFGVWTLGCVVALAGAFTFADWAGTFPRAGGSFVYLREVYGRPMAFLLAWVVLLVISTGALSVMTGFGASMIRDLLPGAGIGPDGSASHTAVSAGLILALTLVALGGAKVGATFQNGCMLIKIGLALTLIVAGLALYRAEPAALAPVAEAAQQPEGFPWRGALLAMLPVLFACGGWPLVAYIATEIDQPAKNLPRAMVLGVLGVTALYLGLNWAYVRVVGLERLAADPTFVGEVVRRTLGEGGGRLLSGALAVSAVGVCAVNVLTTPWLYVAMARERLFFQGFARLHPRTRAPVLGIVLQCVLGLLYACFGDTNFLVESVVFVEWIFHVLIAFGLLWIRARQPELPRPFRSLAYPLMPLVYGVFAAGLVFGVIWQAERAQTVTGLAVFTAGALVYPFWQRWIAERA